MDDNVFDLTARRADPEIEGRRDRWLRYAAWALFVVVVTAVLVGFAAAPTMFTAVLNGLAQ
ncbi:MAG: hypothetical protein PHQ28_00895 [Mycobacterium sp.]|nr:hypothetical protein [Mycobacterium sp.]